MDGPGKIFSAYSKVFLINKNILVSEDGIDNVPGLPFAHISKPPKLA